MAYRRERDPIIPTDTVLIVCAPTLWWSVSSSGTRYSGRSESGKLTGSSVVVRARPPAVSGHRRVHLGAHCRAAEGDQTKLHKPHCSASSSCVALHCRSEPERFRRGRAGGEEAERGVLHNATICLEAQLCRHSKVWGSFPLRAASARGRH